MNDQELVEMLTLLKNQARDVLGESNRHDTLVTDVKLDSFNFVIDLAINRLSKPQSKTKIKIHKFKLKIIRFVMKCPILDGPLSNFKWYRDMIINVATELLAGSIGGRRNE